MKAILALCGVALALGSGTPAALGAPDDPLFVFIPSGNFTQPPPRGYLDGPCGLAASPSGGFYVSDYYHQAIDLFTVGPFPEYEVKYKEQSLVNAPPASNYEGVSHEGILEDPCAIALDGAGTLYLNNYHRNVVRFPSPLELGTGTVIAGSPLDAGRPTGVAVNSATGTVYVNSRTYIAVYDSSGAAVEEGGEPLRIGLGTLADGYGLAVSEYPGTAGYLYVPDAATDTVKVFNPAVDPENPVASISGPGGDFQSLRDSAVAVDRSNGNVYVADSIGSTYSERPQARIEVFDATGGYEGHLKYNVVDADPPGLAVNNSVGSTQGRVFVTSGNTYIASVYAYPPGAATKGPSVPATQSLALASSGSGSGLISGRSAGIDCATVCETQVPSGATISLTATPDPGSSFAGWSGGGCAGIGACTVAVAEATSVRAAFEALRGLPAPDARTAGNPLATASEIRQKGPVRVSVNGSLSPKKLPREGAAPISVAVGWKIATTDESPPPDLKSLQIEINRNGRFDYAGLPVCPYEKIQPATTQRALANCRAALVGEGSFTARIALEGEETTSYDAGGRLLVFNGETRGKHVLFGQIFSARPFSTSFVITFALKAIKHGTYGTVLSATLPKGLRNWGALTGIEMKLSRRFAYRGKSHSFISAGCPAPKGFPGAAFQLARTSFGFVGGTKLTSTLSDSCKVRN